MGCLVLVDKVHVKGEGTGGAATASSTCGGGELKHPGNSAQLEARGLAGSFHGYLGPRQRQIWFKTGQVWGRVL